ncbi:protein of unknown function [Candidatus Hydrogenisulfobacillus filiaventi]|uniref:Uncharacterized protein n=1 Tax=Candidatus Hydrogenisulfobacillus filiaventi TaxID=2707344 RepID=A0A6F8ZDE9_9FIRM|nr:protein of unknown function [Candidatus Hydrogenisulfobacillus filiaventi]
MAQGPEEERRTREEIRAIIRAHRELGPAYEDQLVDQLLGVLQSRRPAGEPGPRRRSRGLAVLTLVLSVPLMGVAGRDAGALGVLGVLLLDAWALYWPGRSPG